MSDRHRYTFDPADPPVRVRLIFNGADRVEDGHAFVIPAGAGVMAMFAGVQGRRPVLSFVADGRIPGTGAGAPRVVSVEPVGDDVGDAGPPAPAGPGEGQDDGGPTTDPAEDHQ